MQSEISIEAEVLDNFIAAAWEEFKKGTEDSRLGANYIEVPAKIKEGKLPGIDESVSETDSLTNPLIFLTGINSPLTVPYFEQGVMKAPAVSIVTGQYGLGKTQLMFQIGEYLSQNPEATLKALPVSLASCRKEAQVLKEDDPAINFPYLLFSHILENFEEASRQSICEEIISRIDQGDILLILDGLDELILDSIEHRNFFASLIPALTPKGSRAPKRQFKIVISARLEYLSVYTARGATDIPGQVNQYYLNPDGNVSVWFLKLEFFEDSRIYAYLTHRLNKLGKRIYEQVAQKSHLFDMLRRPLLLRLFFDTMQGKAAEGLFSSDYQYPADLIEEFVKSAEAEKDNLLTRDRENPSEFTWSANRLADTCLHLYEEGRYEMQILPANIHIERNDVRSILVDQWGHHDSELIKGLSKEHVLKSVHKCPFLKKSGINSLGFAHRIFFEYFIARGMADQLSKECQQARDENRSRSFVAFDELVLNVDMRKFLIRLVVSDEMSTDEAIEDHRTRNKLPDEVPKKDFMREAVWFYETKKAYGLRDTEEWQSDADGERAPKTEEWEILDKNRAILLRSMTDPESPPPETRETIEWFLDLRGLWLHPRYLIPNYEAIAVFFWYQRWDDRTRLLNKKFDTILGERLNQVAQKLYAYRSFPDFKLRRPYKLVLERILNIGQRLRYAWVEDAAKNRKYFLDLIQSKEDLDLIQSKEDEDIQKRIEGILALT